MTRKNNHLFSPALTFIEILFVTIIIGVLIGLSIPQFKKTAANMELEGLTKNIFYLSRYLQTSAIAKQKTHFLNIDPAEGKFWAAYQDKEVIKNLEGKFGRVIQTPSGINVTIDKINPPDKTVVYFYPDGNMDEITIHFQNQYQNKISLSIQKTAGVIKILTEEGAS